MTASEIAPRFFTPPEIAPIHLDVTELKGGGYAPAQFWGKTADGRSVYCRYRGGYLSVDISKDAGSNSSTNMKRILDVRLGPPLHGGMTIGQLCHYVGIQINGEVPPLPTAEEMFQEGARDLSGTTTFFDIWVNSTHDTQKNFLDQFMGRFKNCTIVQPKPYGEYHFIGGECCNSVNDISQDWLYIIFGDQWDRGDLSHWNSSNSLGMIFPDSLVVHINASGFRHPIRKYDNKTAEWVYEKLGKKILIAGQCDEMLHGSFSIHASFGTDNLAKRELLNEVSNFFDEIFPIYHVKKMDVVTGQEFRNFDKIGRYDPLVVEWVNASDNHWYFVEAKNNENISSAIGWKFVSLD